MQRRKIIRVPIKYREKFLLALVDAYLKTFTDKEKLSYADRVIGHSRLNEISIYESDGIINELTKYCPNLIDEWNDTVKNHGE